MRRIILALGLVLGLVSVAGAECSWVLWTQWMIAGTVFPWSPNEAFTSKRECEAAQEKLKRDFAPQPGTKNFVTPKCLPDTIDPRR
jgi:hypothetical protein